MYGAILGDMIGSPYEFDRGSKTKDFPLFSEESGYTDDSVMTVAVAEALLDTMGTDDEAAVKAASRQRPAALRQLGQRLCHARIFRRLAV